MQGPGAGIRPWGRLAIGPALGAAAVRAGAPRCPTPRLTFYGALAMATAIDQLGLARTREGALDHHRVPLLKLAAPNRGMVLGTAHIWAQMPSPCCACAYFESAFCKAATNSAFFILESNATFRCCSSACSCAARARCIQAYCPPLWPIGNG